MRNTGIGLIAGMALLLAAGSAQAQTIELWTFLQPGDENNRERTMTRLVETFKEKHPEIDLRITTMPWQQISPTLLRSVQAGQVPDIAMLYSPSMPAHIAAGSLSPLDEHVNKWSQEDRDDLVVLPENQGRDGTLFGVPWEIRVSGLTYRADILEAEGKQTPDSMEAWAQMAREHSTEDRVGIALGFSPEAPSIAAGWFLVNLVGSGVPVLNEDGTAAFATPEAERLVTWVRDLVVDGDQALPSDVALQGLEQAQQLFISGNAVFLPTSSQRLGHVRERSGLGDAIQMTSYPSFEAGKPSPALVQSWSLVIPRGAENPEAAWTFMEHWISTEFQVIQADMAGYVPVRRSALEDPFFERPEAASIRWALDYAANHPLEFDFPENTDALYDTWARMFGSVLTGQMSPVEGLEWAEQEYDRRRGR